MNPDPDQRTKDKTKDTSQAGSRAGSAASNGHRMPPPDPRGRTPDDPGYNPYDNPRVAEKLRRKREAEEAAEAVTEERLKRFGSRRYALDVLEGRRERWARKLANDMARKNAHRDPTRDMPELVFSGDQAVKAGAPDAQIAALPALEPGDIAELKMRAAAMRRDKRTLRRWLRDQGIVNTAAVTVVSLRGAVSAFDILDPAARGQWARWLAGTDVVILDCLRPVLDALGLSEDKDAGRVLVAFDALLADVGADEGMVVTHMGHQNERARGDSRLLDWGDALWKIVRDGDETDDDGNRSRYLSAVGRDVAVREGLLTFDAPTRHLAYAGGSRKDSKARAAVPELLAMVRAEPGKLSKNAAENRLKEDHGITQQAARAAIAAAIKDGSVTITPDPRNAKMLSPGSDPLANLVPFPGPTGDR